MKTFKLSLFVIFLSGIILLPGIISAQGGITVKGRVKDTKGESVIGAAVLLEGTNIGTVTDLEGNYVLTFVPKAGTSPKLVVSSVGFTSQTVEVGGRGKIDVVLADDLDQLDEVVVVGYGAMRKSDLTGAVTSVRIDENQAAQSGSIDQLLQGHAAGVQVVSNSSAPDASVSVTIRGASSFDSNSQPLYVVDGVIMNTDGALSVGSHQGSDSAADEDNNGLMGISPQDIESIEILKDASATAIYGSQGANGVVLITTKTAVREKPTVTFSAGVNISSMYRKFSLMDAADYKEYLEYKGIDHTSDLYTAFTDDVANGIYAPVDWQDYTTRTSVTQRYYMVISGNPNKTNYRFSLGYHNNQGLVKGTGYSNLTFRLNLEKTLGKLKFGARSSFSYLNSEMTQGVGATSGQTPATSMIMSMLLTRPLRYLPQFDDEGMEIDDEGAPISGPDRWLSDFQSKRIEFRVTPSIFAQYKIAKWLTFKSTFGMDYRATERIKFKSLRINSQATGSTGAVAHMDRMNWNWDNLLMFNKKFGKHSLSGTLGQSARQFTTATQTVEGTNVTQWKPMSGSLNSAPNTWLSYGEAGSQIMSFFGRMVYNYADRYVLTATYRFDGSSKFVGENKWARFPSFAFAWRINKEPWFNIPAVSSAKLRLGWGRVGNQNIPTLQTVYRYSSSTVASHDTPSHTIVSLSSLNLPSPSLKWETTTQYNAGLDLSLFKGRLILAADAYYKVTDDLFQTRTMSASVGVNDPYVNMGAISNRGVELTLNAVPIHKRTIEWTLGGNISFNRNKILSIDPSGASRATMFIYKGEHAREVEYFVGDQLSGDAFCRDYINIFIAGEPMSLFYAMPTDGLVPSGGEGVPFADGAYRGPGAVNFVDTNGDGVITSDDRVIVGDPNPDFTYGFNTSFTFRRLTASVFFNGSYGNDIYNQQKAAMCDVSTNSANRLRVAVFDSWSPCNQDAKYPAISEYAANDVNWCTDRFVEDGSYLRLANASLSYSIPVKKILPFVRNLSVGVSGKNLYIWTKYSGYDPDVNVYGTVKKFCVDTGAYPSSRTFMFDIKVTF